MTFALNALVSACVIATAAWLAGRHPAAAGFLVAMPIATLLALPLTQIQHGDPQATVRMAQSIFVAVPVSLTFFLPFLLASRLQLSFWSSYATGCALLVAGYFLHRTLARLLW